MAEPPTSTVRIQIFYRLVCSRSEIGFVLIMRLATLDDIIYVSVRNKMITVTAMIRIATGSGRLSLYLSRRIICFVLHYALFFSM